MNDVWQIVLGVIASVGGIGGVILIIIKFSVNAIAKHLEERYSLKLNKELEYYKSSLDNKIYISKTKFDTEFGIYRELSKAFFEMVKNISIMIPSHILRIKRQKENMRQSFMILRILRLVWHRMYYMVMHHSFKKIYIMNIMIL